MVISTDGTVVTTWGSENFCVSRSGDGGHTWMNGSKSDILPDGNQHSDYGLMGGLIRLPIEGHDILIFSNIDVPQKEDGGYRFQSQMDRTSTRRRLG